MRPLITKKPTEPAVCGLVWLVCGDREREAGTICMRRPGSGCAWIDRARHGGFA